MPTPGSHPPWKGLQRAADTLRRLRDRVAARTNDAPRFSWFVRTDPLIELACGRAGFALEAYASLFEALEREGDEIGLHVHAARWLPEPGAWINDHGNAAWISECLARGFAAFAEARGREARLFRFGDRYFDDAILAEIERRGVEVDLTVEPDMPRARGHVPSELSSGMLPGTRGAPRRPYRPSRFDFRREARWLRPRAVWEVPVTTGWVPEAVGMVTLNLSLNPVWIRSLLHLTREDGVVVSVGRTGDEAANFDVNVDAVAGLGDVVFRSAAAVAAAFQTRGRATGAGGIAAG